MPKRSDPALVVVTGPPCTGKSTIAEHVAGKLGTTLLSWDWLTAGLATIEPMRAALDALPRPAYRDVGWAAMWHLAELQLRLGHPVVLDGVARRPELARADELARQHGAPMLSIGTRCTDRAHHRALLAARVRHIPGWHELDWAYVERFLAGWEAPPTDLLLDAASPLDDNLRVVAHHLAQLGDRNVLKRVPGDAADRPRD